MHSYVPIFSSHMLHEIVSPNVHFKCIFVCHFFITQVLFVDTFSTNSTSKVPTFMSCQNMPCQILSMKKCVLTVGTFKTWCSFVMDFSVSFKFFVGATCLIAYCTIKNFILVHIQMFWEWGGMLVDITLNVTHFTYRHCPLKDKNPLFCALKCRLSTDARSSYFLEYLNFCVIVLGPSTYNSQVLGSLLLRILPTFY